MLNAPLLPNSGGGAASRRERAPGGRVVLGSPRGGCRPGAAFHFTAKLGLRAKVAP